MSKPFSDAIITTAGAALLARVEAGQAAMEITRVVVGEGIYTPEEREPGSLKDRTALKIQRGSFTPSHVDIVSEDSIRIRALVSNVDPVTGDPLVTIGYFFNELGVYAKERDGASTTECLYCIAITSGDTGDYMPPYEGGGAAQIIQDVYLTVGNAATTYVDIAGAAFLATDGQQLKTDFADLSGEFDDLSDDMAAFKTHIETVVGAPLVAQAAAEMTDTTRVYVYVGSETGYTSGNWYYYDGTSWVSGGVYNATAVNTDKTLTQEDQPADAKKTGDEIADLKQDFDAILVEIEGEQVTLTNLLSLSDMIGRYGTERVGYTDGIATFKTKDGSEVNPEIGLYSLTSGSHDWLVGFKWKLIKKDSTIGDPETIRVIIGNQSHYYDVAYDEWVTFCENDSENLTKVAFQVRGFASAPQNDDIEIQIKELWCYNVDGVSDDLLTLIETQQATNYTDGTVTYGFDDRHVPDTTLSITGKAADSKSVGDAFTLIGGFPRYENIPMSISGKINNNGEDETDANFVKTDYIDIAEAVAVSYAGRMGTYRAAHWYDSNKEWLSCTEYLNDTTAFYENVLIQKPSGAKYLRLQSKTSSASNPPAVSPEVTAFYTKGYVDALLRNIVGDGVSDDTNALQRVVNICDSVTLPAGCTILLSSTINVKLGYAHILNGNGAKLITNGDFYALSVSGTLSVPSTPGMDSIYPDIEGDVKIHNFRITSSDPEEGGGIEVSRAFKLKICDNFIYKCNNGIRLINTCRDMIICNNEIFTINNNGILLDERLNLHQCNIENNIVQFALTGINFNNPTAIANFQVVGNDIETHVYPTVGYTNARCLVINAGSNTSMLAEIEIVGNTIQGHNTSPYVIQLTGIVDHMIECISIVGNHISNAQQNTIKMAYVKNVAISGNTYNNVVRYVYDMDGICSNVIITGDAAENSGGKIHAASTAVLNNIKCKNVLFFTNDTNSIETSDVTNVDITD